MCSLLIEIWVEFDKLAACYNGLCSLDVLFDVFRKSFDLCDSEKSFYSIDIVLSLWIVVVWQDPVLSECKRWFEVVFSTMRIVRSPRRCAVYCRLGFRFVCRLFLLSTYSLRCWVWFLQKFEAINVKAT